MVQAYTYTIYIYMYIYYYIYIYIHTYIWCIYVHILDRYFLCKPAIVQTPWNYRDLWQIVFGSFLVCTGSAVSVEPSRFWGGNQWPGRQCVLHEDYPKGPVLFCSHPGCVADWELPYGNVADDTWWHHMTSWSLAGKPGSWSGFIPSLWPQWTKGNHRSQWGILQPHVWWHLLVSSISGSSFRTEQTIGLVIHPGSFYHSNSANKIHPSFFRVTGVAGGPIPMIGPNA